MDFFPSRRAGNNVLLMCAVSAYFYLGTLAIAGRKERGLPYCNPCLRFTSSRIELSTEASLYRKRRNICGKYSSLLPHYSKTETNVQFSLSLILLWLPSTTVYIVSGLQRLCNQFIIQQSNFTCLLHTGQIYRSPDLPHNFSQVHRGEEKFTAISRSPQSPFSSE